MSDPKPLANRRITLGVTGSIAAYKAADLASQLVKQGADVHVVLTRAGAEFVGPATFRALTLNPVITSTFDEPSGGRIAHIDLAQSADLVLVAPATANVIARMAAGMADDSLTATLLAATAPIIVAPAMNTAMLEHPATVANLETLRSRGVQIVEPACGTLACRTEGPGKLAEVEDILRAVVEHFRRKEDYRGIRLVVTAGPTREPLDPVRYLSNRSSGKMGYAIARAGSERGADVTLISGPAAISPPCNVNIVRVATTQEMLAASMEAFPDCDLFVGAAAPADYRIADPLDQKRKKSAGDWTLRLVETPDILATLSAKKDAQVIVGFAAETRSLLENAAEKLARKDLDLIVANDVTARDSGFEVDTNQVTMLWPDGRIEKLPLLSKDMAAHRILDAARALILNPAR